MNEFMQQQIMIYCHVYTASIHVKCCYGVIDGV